MQDRVQTLLEAAETPPTYFLQYTRTRARCGILPVFVFEGVDDPKYYTPRIQYRFSNSWRPLSIKGKSNVLALRDDLKVHPDYCNDKTGFIVDRDFDLPVVGDNIYTTPCYSVENLYLNEGVIRNLLSSLGGLSNNTDEELQAIDWVLNIYNKYRNTYESSRKAKRMNLIFLYVRKKLNDRKVSLSKLFEVSHDLSEGYTFSIKPKKFFLDLRKKIDFVDFKNFVRTDKVARAIINGDGEFYRGKQQILFLREFLNSLKTIDKALNLEVQKNVAVKIVFKNTNLGADILSDLSSVAVTPVCLVQFLDNIFKE